MIKKVAKYFVIIIGVLTFLSAFSSNHSGIAHFAHLGGMVIGFLYIKKGLRLEQIIEKWNIYRRNRKLKVIRSKQKQMKDLRGQVDDILDKISKIGYDNISDEEKKILHKASHYLFKDGGEEN